MDKSLDEIITELAEKINKVYHLEKDEAIKKLRSTSFFSKLTKEENELWKRNIDDLFSIYQDEIETGHFTIK